MSRVIPLHTEIVSVMPSAGWWIVFRDDTGEVREPVIALALVEYHWVDGPTRSLVPMVTEGAGVVLADGCEYGGLVYLPSASNVEPQA